MSSKGLPFARLFFRKTNEKAQAVRQTLALAIETRTDFNMDFFVHKRLAYQFKGACVEARSDAVKVYMRGSHEHLPPAGMEVHVYFSLRIDRKSVPFDFAARVLSTEREGRDAFLWLNAPEELGHNQRRYNVRVPVSKEEIRDFQVWYGKPLVKTGEENAEGGGPRVRWVPISLEHTELLDVSAGGLQLVVAPEASVYPYLSPREVLLAKGTFELRDKNPQQLAMVGAVVRMDKGEDRPLASLGVSFKRWATLVDGRFVWRHLAEQEGISPLAAWVFQLILNRRRLEREGRDEARSGREKGESQRDHDKE